MSVLADRDQAFVAGIRQIADEVAAPNADDVDRNARFPQESLDALREQRALSAFVPEELGGDGVSLRAVAEACFELGRRCGASAMVFAMHQIQVATIVRHLDGAPFFEDYLRELADQQRLIASVTSEVGTGGDMGRSIAALTPAGDGMATFEKQAPTVSYGAYADDLLTTLRSGPDAEAGDQVVALSRREQTTLEPKGTWDPLGMRGTCSPGYVVRAEVPAQQVLAVPFSAIASQTMVPVSHLLWSHLWLGISTDAFDRARAFVRAAARQKPGQPVPAAVKLSHVMSDLSLLRAEVRAALDEFLRVDADDRDRLGTMAMALLFNNLKVAASDQAPRVCQGAMNVCGIVGFKNDTPFSIGRHLRDTMSASLMVANERIHQTNAGLLLIAKEV
ncbi:MAG TPA: acyl-CoA dehydrogenase family protein [Baekduia sp.]|nr:acyl-CoA dehydrogenase family protein [Baekduia sp.]